MLEEKQRIEIVGLLVGIWFILSLPLPWLITVPDVAQQQLLIISNDRIDLNSICWSSSSMDSKTRISK